MKVEDVWYIIIFDRGDCFYLPDNLEFLVPPKKVYVVASGTEFLLALTTVAAKFSTYGL